VRAFFEQHGASRFEDVTSKDQRVISRAGFFRADAAGNREYLVLPEVFKQAVCSGFDCRTATHTLQARGWLLPGRDRVTQNVRLPGIGVTRIYALGGRMWEDET
jgi:hypothetical protein